jgi:preprotein translocase subunit SecD
MIVLYRLPGIAATIALLMYILISFAILKLLHATLTLPGLAGFILTIGIAVDANVLIFERIKEELALGQSSSVSIQNGFSRALTSILDSNITTLIAATALFALGTGSIKGFAVTLSVGIVVSMFTAILATRVILNAILILIKKEEVGIS